VLIQNSIDDADNFDLNLGWVDEFGYQQTKYAIPDVGLGYLYVVLDNPGYPDLLVGIHGPDDYPCSPRSYHYDRPDFPVTDRCNYPLGVGIVRQRLYSQNVLVRHPEIVLSYWKTDLLQKSHSVQAKLVCSPGSFETHFDPRQQNLNFKWQLAFSAPLRQFGGLAGAHPK